MLKIITGVDLVYLQPFRRNSVLNYAVQPKIAKNLVKTLIFRFKVVQKLSMLKNLKSSLSSISVPICSRFHTRQANIGKITSFKRGYPY